MIRMLAAGLALTGVAGLIAWWLAGRAGMEGAVAGGAVAVVVQLGALALMRDKPNAPASQFLGRWALGSLLRLTGVVMMAALVVVGGFPPLPTALGFVGVIIPLLGLELRVVD